MTNIKIDNVEYDIATVSDNAKAQLQMIQAVDQEIARLKMKLAIAQTARNAYVNAIKAALPTPLEQTLAQGDTLKLG